MKKTHEIFVKEIRHKFNGLIDVVSQYIGNKTKISFRCNACGNEFITTPQSILHSKVGCPKCANTQKQESAKQTYMRTKEKFFDHFPEAIEMWDYDKNNGVNINELSLHSPYKAHWACKVCGYNWQSRMADMADGRQNCPNCYRNSMTKNVILYRLKNNGSFADKYPELLNEWDYCSNHDVNPYDLLPKSNKKYFWKCQMCGYIWKTSIAHRVEGEQCPSCSRAKSKLQILTENYIQENYDFELNHEYKCKIKCINPKTGFVLPYDNELIISDLCCLIIECQGQQHYEVCGWTKTVSKHDGTPVEDILEYQQWRDEYKKQYAISQGYHYLAIPYTAFEDDTYKQLIDDKISYILSQNSPKEEIA